MLQCALQLGILWTLRSLLNYGNKRAPLHVAPGRDLSSGPSSGVHAGPPSAQFAAAAAADQAQQATATANTSTFSSPSRSNFQFPTFAQTQQNATPGRTSGILREKTLI